MGKLFDITKDGKGVSKNETQKRPFFKFFDFFLRNAWRFVWVNLAFTLCSVPVVTNGLANVGMSYVARTVARDKHSFGFSDFLDSIKKNWKQGLIVGIINTVVYYLIFVGIFTYLQIPNIIVRMVTISLTLTAFILISIMNFYIPTMINTFNYTLGQLYKNAFRFTFISFWKNLFCLIALVSVLVGAFGLAVLCGAYSFFVLVIETIIFAAFYPFFANLLVQFVTFPSLIKYVIEPYYEKHPDEDIELRRELGLEIKSDDDDFDEFEEEDDSIFTD